MTEQTTMSAANLPCDTYECVDRLWCIQRGICKRAAEWEPPYRVEENQDKLCPTCGEGVMFNLIGPDDIALGVSFRDETDADEWASALNAAFDAGRKSSQ